ncbi:MAG: hypothetical protein V3573_00270 [Desulfovibrionaceae bacterium]
MPTQHDPETNLLGTELLRVLRECLYGSEENGAFLDPGDNGLLGLLPRLSANEASLPAAGASVATHALHVSFSLDVFIDWISGKRDINPDWQASWARSNVDDAQWAALLRRLKAQCATLEAAVETHMLMDDQSAWGALGALAHTAYHLGVIQVKLDVLRSGKNAAPRNA